MEKTEFSDTSSLYDGEDILERCERDIERKTLARKENKAVFWLRGTVLLVLVIAAAVVTTFVFKYIEYDQQMDFENAFNASAAKVLETFHDSVERKIEALDSLAVQYTSYAIDKNISFPFVTLPHIDIRGANTRILSDSVAMNWYPLVRDEERDDWEKFMVENRDTMFTPSLHRDNDQRAKQDARFKMNISAPAEVIPFPLKDHIEDLTPDGSLIVSPEQSGPYLPLWQQSPVVPMPSTVGFNALSHPAGAGAYSTILNTKEAVMGDASNLEGEHLGPTGPYFKLIISLGQYRHNIEKLIEDPTSALGYPVFDSFDTENRKVVGVIASNLYWRLYFQDILPPNAKGIICVLENTKNQTFSYRIDGAKSEYLGNGDKHNKKYNHLEVKGVMADYLAQKASPETYSYTSVKLNSDYCAYTIRIYPSDDSAAEFVNMDPLTFSLVILGVFLFTSMVFLIYDCLVARRQRIVMDRAVASSAIVSSLFPSQVRDQIYEESKREGEKKAEKKEWKNTENVGSGVKGTSTTDTDSEETSRPIAEVFENATILFADLAGFTAWSAKRTPVEVFELLETIYIEFDKIAIRRRVFKVETIGDCYVAATGLPEPQDDHAVRMAKFARDCMAKIRQLTMELAETLGPDTADLEMRVGLHSGSVTGGVIRGDNCRFQLFGDTMNTASRMESNGVKGRIHVSQETADELIAQGKSSWVSPREDKIVAKGKGQLDTFWVNPQEGVPSTVGSTTASQMERDLSSYLGKYVKGNPLRFI